MSENLKLFLMLFVGTLAGSLGLTKCVTYAQRAECIQRWEGSTFQPKYSGLGGCRIRMPDGSWIPEDRYRVIEQ